jgi:hypothetical protein
MPSAINLVVTCTKKKFRLAPDALQLRNLRSRESIEARSRLWIERLETETGEAMAAERLYCGDHWAVVREMAAADLFQNKGIRIWICSAGYGLIPLDSLLLPYSATFSTGHADSVSAGRSAAVGTAHAVWWEQLARWRGPRPGAPRSIAALRESSPNDLLLVVMSATYLFATAKDLREAANQASPRAERFAILCSGVRKIEGLTPYMLPCDARLRQRVGGALASLNIRVARQLLGNTTPSQWSLSRLRAVLSGWLDAQPEPVRYDRSPMTDEDVRKVIRHALKDNPAIRPTPLLRRLRDSGRACEHSRFSRLFHEAAGIGHGNL